MSIISDSGSEKVGAYPVGHHLVDGAPDAPEPDHLPLNLFIFPLFLGFGRHVVGIDAADVEMRQRWERVERSMDTTGDFSWENLVT